MKWINQSLFRRLLISYLFIFILGFGIIGIVISTSSKDYLTDQKRQEMLQQAGSINGAIYHSEVVTPEVLLTIEQLGEFSNSNIWLFDDSGQIVATSSRQDIFVGEPISDDLLKEIMDGQNRIQVMDIEGEERPMLSVIVPWGSNEQIHGGIILHSPIAGINSTIRNIREIVQWAIIGGLIIVTILVSYLSWSISKPLKKVEEATNEIALGNYSKRVEHDNQFSDEISELIKSFNRMAEKLNTIENERGTLEKRRNDFIANISHELRTPLTAMKGFLEALQDGLVKDTESQQKYYAIMYRETEYLNHLVNDLMDLIKLERQDISLDLYCVHLQEIIRKVALNLQPSIESRNNDIIIDAPDNIPPVIGDSIRLEQIFKNIIHNANKFTENGSITIKLEEHCKDNVCVKISDNGIGIPSYDVKRIWERFFKVDRVRQKKERGTGLGLAIVKELVQLHHGEITVESELGVGTTFTIFFPTQRKKGYE
ncbi:sensor histidine kinase [Evansella cellulosilytica]|uniref:histidine kinase n=1 Tax=Evansella cellulosilytica (strain ATCC 21833 / DSM 2522 / FERM P-1141 / JCM 9156 / N-4) TaxID=649639 RepID=E6U0V3_EVAC2|nr:ATP-binding protein [Evansella cellulosilytica]ADU30265.1 integral membrane sensor signal transduction histidine kinase [Evansella cellulosilytica DSM 2522]